MSAADIRTALAVLGDTPEAIAASLANKGITGLPKEHESCPVAFFLTEQGFRYVSVSRSMILWRSDEQMCRIMGVPSPVAEFVRRFDRGYYPELEATDA